MTFSRLQDLLPSYLTCEQRDTSSTKKICEARPENHTHNTIYRKETTMSYSGHIPSEGAGVLFQAEKKHPKAPDMTGQIMIEGKVVKLAAWTRQS